MTDWSASDRAWSRMEAAADAGRDLRLADLMNPGRLRRLGVKAAGLYVDLSRQAFTDEGLRRSLDLVRDCDVEGRRGEMFAGRRINLTEDRAVEHWRLREPEPGPELAAERERMRVFVDAVRSGALRTADQRKFRAVLHIGIGGSDLGPRLLWDALRPERAKLEMHFAANVDPDAFAAATRGLDPRRTLVIAVSKTFGTLETLANLGHARAWLSNAIGEGADSHLAAVSANPERCARFGIPAERVFPMSDSVGGRFSVWSAVGLSCAIGLGWRVWSAFLAGAHAMDAHFRTASPERNAPMLMALAQVYNRNGLGRAARAVIPYAERLRLLPSWLQQLEMESNGKRVRLDGSPSPRATAPVVFGEPGTTSQHAFFQLLHQGTDVVPVDFVLAADRGTAMLANGVAQAEALFHGQSDSAEPWKDFPGDRPSTSIVMKAIEPRAVGALLALYEHKTFVEGVLWGIDSFDQWGVELGKTLAARLMPELDGEAGPSGDDVATKEMIGRLRG